MRNIAKSEWLLAAIIAVLATGISAAVLDADTFLGRWEGTLDLAEGSFEIKVTFAMDDTGQITGKMDIPAESAYELKLGRIETEGRKISFIIDDSGAQGGIPTFTGSLDEEGETISGEFKKGAADGFFSLKRKHQPSIHR
jgi:hypothetical protein